MEWPKELLEIFKDEIFENVHPTPTKITNNDRLRNGFLEICEWYEKNNRIPQKCEKENLESKYAYRLLSIIKSDSKREFLRKIDIYNLLDIEL